MDVQHEYTKLLTVGDMKKAIEHAERLGYTDQARIDPVVFFREPGTYRISQDADALRSP